MEAVTNLACSSQLPTQYAFPYGDETVSELERASAHAAGVEPAEGDT